MQGGVSIKLPQKLLPVHSPTNNLALGVGSCTYSLNPFLLVTKQCKLDTTLVISLTNPATPNVSNLNHLPGVSQVRLCSWTAEVMGRGICQTHRLKKSLLLKFLQLSGPAGTLKIAFWLISCPQWDVKLWHSRLLFTTVLARVIAISPMHTLKSPTQVKWCVKLPLASL